MSPYERFIQTLPRIGYFSSIPAGMIDRAYLEEPRGYLGRLALFIKIRVFLGLFLILSSIDVVTTFLLSARYAAGVLLSTDALQNTRLGQFKAYSTLFSKNLYALLASVTGIGFVYPKLLVFYFTPEKKDTRGVSAGGSYYHDLNAELKQPESPEELQRIIQDAIKAQHKIIPVGAGQSQGKQFLSEGGSQKTIVVDLSKFNSMIINPDDKTATVGAGVRWSDLQVRANEQKMAIKVMQASNVFSIGGSIGTNIHGWDYHGGVLSNTILSMDIIDVTGERRTIKPTDPLFFKITGGLGLYGIVCSVKIKLADNDRLTRESVSVQPKDYVNYFNKNLKNNEESKLHLYRLSLDPKAPFSEGFTETYVKKGNEPPVVTPYLSTLPAHGTRTERLMVNIARRFAWVRKLWWDHERDDFLTNHPTVTRNEAMQVPINAMFNPSVSESEWLQEYFLPEGELAPFLEKLGQLFKDNKVVLLNATVRFVKQHDKSPLSYAHDGDRYAVVVAFNQSLKSSKMIEAQKWLRQAQHLAIEHKGAYYLPYQHVSSPDDFKKAYPHAAEAQQYKEKIDKNQVFTSGLHQKYMAPHPVETDHVRAVMGDPELKKSFEGFLDNIFQRLDSKKIYGLLDDILKYKDTHEEIYEELCRRLPEIKPSFLGDTRRKLSSLSAIKQDLGEQAHDLLPAKLTTINGLVEVGSPGRFVGGFKQHYHVKGTVVAVTDSQSVTDYIDAGSLHPYDQFVKLDYNKLDLSHIPDKSADVMTCYVGLHHFPDDQLDLFLKNAKRILRDGGHFLLVDHDIQDKKEESMAHLAHVIFNAVDGVSVADEMQERRNFQPMTYWRKQLEKHGLAGDIAGPDVPMIREGDPTRNRMISAVNAKPQPSVTAKKSTGAPLEPDYKHSLAGPFFSREGGRKKQKHTPDHDNAEPPKPPKP